jgi:hypothetical protein
LPATLNRYIPAIIMLLPSLNIKKMQHAKLPDKNIHFQSLNDLHQQNNKNGEKLR